MPPPHSKPQRPDLLHRTFAACLLLKGLNALLELGTAAILWLVAPGSVGPWMRTLTAGELAEDPNDLLANWLVAAGGRYSAHAQHFAIFYLIFHGTIKLGLVFLLWRQKPWAYPLSAGVLALFAAYLLLRWSQTHSVVLVPLAAFDLVLICLILREHRRIKLGPVKH